MMIGTNIKSHISPFFTCGFKCVENQAQQQQSFPCGLIVILELL